MAGELPLGEQPPTTDWWPADWITAPEAQAAPMAPVQAPAPLLPPPAPDVALEAAQAVPVAPAPMDQPPPQQSGWWPPDWTGGASPAPAQALDVPRGTQLTEAPVATPDASGQAPIFPWSLDIQPQPQPDDSWAARESTAAGEMVADRGAEQLVQAGPEEAAAEGERQAAKQRNFLATHTLQEDERRRRIATESHTRWQAREAIIDAERQSTYAMMKELTATGVNNDHWWQTRSTGQKVASYISAISGGLLSPYTGGRNAGLEMVFDAMNQDLETQKVNLQQRRESLGMRMGILGQLSQHSADIKQAEDALRLATFENADQRLAAKAAQLDPAGTSAQRIATARLQVRAAQKKAAAEIETERWKRHVDTHQMEMQELQLREQRAARGEQAAARRAAQGEQAAGRVLEAKKAGLVYDASGALVEDPTLPLDSGEGDEVFNPETGEYESVPGGQGRRGRGAEQDRLAHERLLTQRQTREAQQRALNVVDTTGAFLGRARGTEAQAGEVRLRISAHADFRKTMGRLLDSIQNNKRVYKGLGSSQWPTETKTEIERYRVDLANQLAKLRDPTTANRQSEVDAAMREIPDVDGWISSRNPLTSYKVLVKTADDRLDDALTTSVDGYTPDKRSPARAFRALDRIYESEDSGKARPREDLIKEITSPISGTLPPAMRDSAVTALSGRIQALGDRGGIKREEVAAIKGAFDAQLAAGGITEEQYTSLTGALASTALVQARSQTQPIGPLGPLAAAQEEQ